MEHSVNGLVGRVTPCAPQMAKGFPNGAHGVTRPTAGSDSIRSLVT